MKRTTISLTDELGDALEREARRRNLSSSAIARDALAAYLGIGDAKEARKLPFASVGRSGHSTTAREMEDLLAQEWDYGAGGR
jgi:predicted transcriptional regulator